MAIAAGAPIAAMAATAATPVAILVIYEVMVTLLGWCGCVAQRRRRRESAHRRTPTPVSDPRHMRYSLGMAADVFAAVPEHELRAAGRRRTFDRDEVVFHRDDPGDSLHRVEKGRFAARIITPLGATATLALHAPGDVFGLLAVV